MIHGQIHQVVGRPIEFGLAKRVATTATVLLLIGRRAIATVSHGLLVGARLGRGQVFGVVRDQIAFGLGSRSGKTVGLEVLLVNWPVQGLLLAVHVLVDLDHVVLTVRGLVVRLLEVARWVGVELLIGIRWEDVRVIRIRVVAARVTLVDIDKVVLDNALDVDAVHAVTILILLILLLQFIR